MGFFAVLGLTAAVVVAVSLSSRRKRLNALAVAAATLERGAIDHDRREVYGTLHGVPVVFRLAIRGDGDSASRWTEIDVAAGTPSLAFHLWPQDAEAEAHVRQGRAVDLELGDPAFDRAYVVEAAPADVVRLLLDARTRAQLVALGGVTITRSHGVVGLRLEERGWMHDQLRIRGCLDVIARLAAQVPTAIAAADQAVVEARGAAYRGTVAAPTWQEVRAERSREVAAVESVRFDRDAYRNRRTLRFAIFAIGLLVFFLAVLRGCPS